MNLEIVAGPDAKPDATGKYVTEPLPPGGPKRLTLRTALTVDQWIEHYKQREAGAAVNFAVVNVYNDDDNGVTDTWVFKVRANPLEPVGDADAGRWQLRTDEAERRGYLEEPLFRTRTYFESRLAKARLPRSPLIEDKLKEQAAELAEEFPASSNLLAIALGSANSVVSEVLPAVVPGFGLFLSIVEIARDAKNQLVKRRSQKRNRVAN